MSKPIHGSLVLGSLGRLFLLNSRKTTKGKWQAHDAAAGASAVGRTDPRSQPGFCSFKVSRASGPFLLNDLLRYFSRKEMKGALCIGKKSRKNICSAFT